MFQVSARKEIRIVLLVTAFKLIMVNTIKMTEIIRKLDSDFLCNTILMTLKRGEKSNVTRFESENKSIRRSTSDKQVQGCFIFG